MSNRSYSFGTSLSIGWLALGSAILLGGCGQATNADPATPTPAPVEVALAKPEKHDVARLIELPAEVQPVQEATIYAKAAGYLGKVLVDKGDSVKSGQLLAVIQAPELQADKAQAASAYASEVFKTQRTMATKHAGDDKEQRAKFDADQAKAQEDQAAANVRKMNALLIDARQAVLQAGAEREKAAADLDAARAEVLQAEADLHSARSESSLADATYERYRKIYERDRQLIAYQDVETAQTASEVAKNKVTSAEGKFIVMQKRVQQAQAEQRIAQSKFVRSQSQLSASGAQLDIAHSDLAAHHRQVDSALREVSATHQQALAAAAEVGQAKSQADAQGSVSQKAAALSNYANLVSPFAGTITKRFVDAGAFVQIASNTTSATAIVTVSDLSSIRLYLNVPEGEAIFVHPGTEVRITLSTDKKAVLKGKVSRTSNALDPKSRTLLAEVDLPNGDRKILAGAYATAKVVLQTHKDVMSLPSKAVGSEKSGRFVWVFDGGKAKHVSVKAGFDDGTHIEIKEGLTGSEQVAAEKLDVLTPGAPIKAKQP